MALRVKETNARLPMKKPMSAIALTGRFINGASGASALRITPKMMPTRKVGYRETFFQKS